MRRNSSLFLIIIFFPRIDFNETNPEPEYAVLPEPDEEISSLSSKVEDLNLTNFQKDQKIKFRDGQINNLKEEINDLKINYEKMLQKDPSPADRIDIRAVEKAVNTGIPPPYPPHVWPL